MNHWLFYPLAIIFFFLDSCCFAFFEQPFIFSLLCFYIHQQLKLSVSIGSIAFGTALLLLQSFLYYGLFTPPLAFIIPMIALSYMARHSMHTWYLLKYLLLALCLLIHCLILTTLLFGIPCTGSYTLSTLFVNIVIMALIP